MWFFGHSEFLLCLISCFRYLFATTSSEFDFRAFLFHYVSSLFQLEFRLEFLFIFMFSHICIYPFMLLSASFIIHVCNFFVPFYERYVFGPFRFAVLFHTSVSSQSCLQAAHLNVTAVVYDFKGIFVSPTIVI